MATDYFLYWFMLPLSTLIATTAMLGGIGGAAMFMPIFLIIFPLLGPEYTLVSPIAAIGVALLTESFGFSSGLIGYIRRGLIDFHLAKLLIIAGVPAAILGAFLSRFIDPNILKLLYGILMLTLAYFLLRKNPKEMNEITKKALVGEFAHIGHERKIVAKDGKIFKYHICHRDKGSYITSIGGFITGLMSVGIGEVVMPRLIKHCKIPMPVAAATSVLVVIITVMSASFTHISTLISEDGIEAVPWNLVMMYTALGVIIGGQIGSKLQGRINSEKMERIIAILFVLIGISMIWITFTSQNI